ncbi:unnamed protein product [Durusdinium trenchii]|uniref:UBC core domain-containing protein n=1 Tax=Durusdinium trenchii TaxID=1381693 RepID=A0ABP0NDP1_9DINO
MEGLYHGGAVAVISDQEHFSELVAAHPNLSWSSACEQLRGSQGILINVDETDGTVKLDSLVQREGQVVTIEAVQWLPFAAVVPIGNAEKLEAAFEEARKAREAAKAKSRGAADSSAAHVSTESFEVPQADRDWMAAGRSFPFELIVTTMTGNEARVQVTSLAERLEAVREKVARKFGKVAGNVKLTHNGCVLPHFGKLEKLADELAVDPSLQVVFVKRQMNPQVVKRLRKEQRDFDLAGWNFDLAPVEDEDIEPLSDTWSATFQGPMGTPYENGLFRLKIRIPEDYPFRPPRINFETKVWCPHVNPRHGSIELDLLSDHWSPALSLAKVIASIIGLLEAPSDGGCENSDAMMQLRESWDAFNQKAREWTRMYAS